MAEIAVHTGWTFDQIREISLDEEAAIRRALNEKFRQQNAQE